MNATYIMIISHYFIDIVITLPVTIRKSACSRTICDCSFPWMFHSTILCVSAAAITPSSSIRLSRETRLSAVPDTTDGDATEVCIYQMTFSTEGLPVSDHSLNRTLPSRHGPETIARLYAISVKAFCLWTKFCYV